MPSLPVRMIKVRYVVLSGLLVVISLRERMAGKVFEVGHLVPPGVRFTCLAHLQRFLETRTGQVVTCSALEDSVDPDH